MSTPYNRPESRRESPYLTFTPRRSAIASFDNLVVLANYEEHLREARKIVWRDRGEPAVDIHDIRDCLVHGARGGLRTSWDDGITLLPFPYLGPHLHRCQCYCLCYSLWREPCFAFSTY